jgi:MFS family permease
MALDPEDIRLLANARFRRLLESRLMGQTAQNAMLYGLLILVVKESGSTIAATLLVVALVLPSIVIGIPAGAVADLIPKRFTLAAGYLARAAVAGALVYYSGNLAVVYLLAAASSVINQFFVPAEAATVPGIVRRDQLPAANSLMVFSLIVAQVAGMVLMAPLLLKLVGEEALFITCAALFLAAALVIGWMASGLSAASVVKASSHGIIEATREGLRILRSDRHAYLAVVYLTMAVTLSRVLVVLLPAYTTDVLDIAPEDTVFVAAPAAIGAGLGLISTPPLTRLFGAWRLVVFGFALLLLGLTGLGLVVYVRDFLETHARLEPGIQFVEDEVGVSSVITAAMLLAIPIGLAFTVVGVAARVVMNERAPPEAQGRVFAAQGAVGDLFSLLPLLIIGGVSELLGVRATLLVASLLAAAVAIYFTFSRRFGPRPQPSDPDLDSRRPPPLTASGAS